LYSLSTAIVWRANAPSGARRAYAAVYQRKQEAASVKIQVEVEFGQIKGGVSARAPQVGLAGHGLDREEALEALLAALKAWAGGLNRVHLLAKALKHRSIAFDDNGSALTIDIVPSQTGMVPSHG
jgi:hypothetical protein